MKNNKFAFTIALFALALVPALALAETPSAERNAAQETTGIITLCEHEEGDASCNTLLEVQEVFNRSAKQVAKDKWLNMILKDLESLDPGLYESL